MKPRIFRSDTGCSGQCNRFRRKHAEIGDSSRDQDDCRGHEGEFGSHAPITVEAAEGACPPPPSELPFKEGHGRFHSARATVLTVGRLVRPAPAHPRVSRLEVWSTIRVLTT